MKRQPITDVSPPAPAMTAYQSALNRVMKDSRLMATHVSLFTAMFASWQIGGYASPFNVNRRQLMAFAKIASISTYHRCIRELDKLGYIKYQPSYHPKQGSLIYWPDINPR